MHIFLPYVRQENFSCREQNSSTTPQTVREVPPSNKESPYCLFILWWTSTGLSPSLTNEQITMHFSSLVHGSKGVAILDLVCWHRCCAHATKEGRHNTSVLQIPHTWFRIFLKLQLLFDSPSYNNENYTWGKTEWKKKEQEDNNTGRRTTSRETMGFSLAGWTVKARDKAT